jgi:hypothetical protein
MNVSYVVSADGEGDPPPPRRGHVSVWLSTVG